jgi:hypothetical protein
LAAIPDHFYTAVPKGVSGIGAEDKGLLEFKEQGTEHLSPLSIKLTSTLFREQKEQPEFLLTDTAGARLHINISAPGITIHQQPLHVSSPKENFSAYTREGQCSIIP